MAFVETALSFGLRLAPKRFMAFVVALEWIFQQEGICLIM